MATGPGEVSGSLQSLCITLSKPLENMLLLFNGIITKDDQKISNRPLMKSQREYTQSSISAARLSLCSVWLQDASLKNKTTWRNKCVQLRLT